MPKNTAFDVNGKFSPIERRPSTYFVIAMIKQPCRQAPQLNYLKPIDMDASDALVALMPDLLRGARALTRSRDEAEDLLQEALLRIWSRARAGGEIDDLKPYAFATLRNRARTRPRSADEDELTDDIGGVAPEAPRRIAFNDVLAAIAQLPQHQRRLLILLLQKGLSYKELAKAENVPIGTIMSRLARARTALRASCGLEPDASVATLYDEAS